MFFRCFRYYNDCLWDVARVDDITARVWRNCKILKISEQVALTAKGFTLYTQFIHQNIGKCVLVADMLLRNQIDIHT